MLLCVECLCYFSVLSYFSMFHSSPTVNKCVCVCVRIVRTRKSCHDISICCATLLKYVSSEMMWRDKRADNKRKCLKCTDNMPDGCLIPVTECSCISFMLLEVVDIRKFSCLSATFFQI